MIGYMLLLSLFGLLECFFGYRIFRIILLLFGFFIGGVLGYSYGGAISNGNVAAAILVGFFGGIVGAGITVFLRFIGIFLIGAFLGLLCSSLLGMIGLEIDVLFMIIMAIIGGVLCLVLDKLMIIVATSFGGAWLTVFGFACIILGNVGILWEVLIGSQAMYSVGALFITLNLTWITLGVIGILIQYEIIPFQKYVLKYLPIEQLQKKWQFEKEVSNKQKSEQPFHKPESEEQSYEQESEKPAYKQKAEESSNNVEINHSHRKKYSLLAAFLNYFWAGAGNLYLGQKTKGTVFFGVTLLIILFLIFYRYAIDTTILMLIHTLYTLVMIIDAVLLAGRINKGEIIKEWDFFKFRTQNK